MASRVCVIPEVHDELERELNELETVKKPELLRLLAELRDEIGFDDRTDDGVTDQLEALERREAALRGWLAEAEIVPKGSSGGVADVGSTVTVDDGQARSTYVIVGSVGADPERGWITTESPLGASLLGKRPGDRVEMVTPSGRQEVTIASVD